jgi:PAS domain S-box-containing protein
MVFRSLHQGSANLKRLIFRALQFRTPVIIAISIGGLVIGLSYTGWLQVLEWACFDQFIRLRPVEPPDQRVVVVGINESDIQQLGQWPISDQILASVLQKIKAQHPRVIGLDLYRDLPIEPGSSNLSQVFESTPNLIGIEKVLGRSVSPPPVLESRQQVAIADLIVDQDGKIRRGLLSIDMGTAKTTQQKFSFGLKLALAYLEPEKIAPQQIGTSKRFQLGQVIFSPLNPNSGGYIGADTAGYQVLLNLRKSNCKDASLNCAFILVSLMDVLEDRLAPNLMHDRIVIIGSVAPSLGDRFYTSYSVNDSVQTGVEIHAELTSQIISSALDDRSLIHTFPDGLEWLWIWIGSSSATALGFSFLRGHRRVLLVMLGMGAGIILISYGGILLNWWMPAFAPFLATVISGVISISYVLYQNLKRSYQQLEDYAQTLEQKVKERTQELQLSTEALQARTEELRKSEAKFFKAFEASPAPIAIVSLRTGRYLEINHSFLEATGYEVEAVKHKTAEELGLWVSLEDHLQFFQHIEEDGEVHNFECQYRTAAGEIRTALVSGEVIDLPEEANCLLAIMNDITDRKKMEEDLKQAQQEALAASRIKSDFLAGMSHELRTPLNAILGFTNLMARVPLPQPEHQQYLQIIGHSSEHLMSLINNVLDLSKIEAGKVTLDLTSFNLHSLLETLKNMFKLRAESKSLELILDLDASVPQYVKADERKLSQVLINLLSNAIKFTNQGVVCLRANCRELITEDNTQSNTQSLTTYSLVFEVADTGPGIPPEELDQLFEAFGQTSTGRQAKEGTGLGLPISQNFVQLMGGELRVESTVGEGTMFQFTLEVEAADMAELEKPEPYRVISLKPDQPKHRLLVVDDRVENRILLSKLLSSVGLEVREATNGRQAVEVWQRWKPDLIWLDIHMPVMDGYQAAQEIRRRELAAFQKRQVHTNGELHSHRLVPLIAITATALVEDQPRMFACGFDDVVYKPFKEQLIYEKVAKYLGVEYLYEEPKGKSASRPKTWLMTFDATDLRIMPESWLNQLYQAAIEGDDEQIFQLITQIPSSETHLINTLRAWANEFRFEEIAALINPTIPVQ